MANPNLGKERKACWHRRLFNRCEGAFKTKARRHTESIAGSTLRPSVVVFDDISHYSITFASAASTLRVSRQ